MVVKISISFIHKQWERLTCSDNVMQNFQHLVSCSPDNHNSINTDSQHSLALSTVFYVQLYLLHSKKKKSFCNILHFCDRA